MNLKKYYQNKANFYSKLRYFGVLVITDQQTALQKDYCDIEEFIFEASCFDHSSRTLEGLMTWLKKYGAILSPSKLRRMILNKKAHDPAVLGAFLDFVERYHNVNFAIVKKLCRKFTEPKSLLKEIPVSIIRNKNKIFLNWGLVVTDYDCDEQKFIEEATSLFERCVELKNRVIMGSVVHSDIESLRLKNKDSMSRYQIAKHINNLSGSVGRALALNPLFASAPAG